MNLKLIIFDCDGVLVDTEPATHAILARSLSGYGLAMTASEATNLFVGGTMLGVRDEARKMGADLPDHWIDEIYGQIYARLEQGVDLIEGVLDVIDKAEAAGLAIAIASNGPMEKMRRSLGHSGLWTRFEGRIYSREHHAPKPAPDMVFHAMKMAGTEAHQTVMIDDSASGCGAPVAAQVRCLGYATEGQDGDLVRAGAEVANSMAGVARALGL